MTRLSFCGCVLLLAFGGAARAELYCAETPHDAGQVSGGSLLAHRFTLINRGASTIEITEVKPGCGCLRPHLDHPTLRPKEQTALIIEINTLTQASGPNLWRAVVHYRENGQPAELAVHVRAVLIPVVSVQPATVMIYTQKAAHGTFTLTERLDRALTIRGLSTASPHVRASCSEPARQDGVWIRIVSLDVLTSMPEGRHEDVLKILTDDSRYAELSIPFVVIKRSPDRVQASPSSLNLIQAAGPLASRIVMLDVDEEKVVMVDRVETSHPFIHCTWAAGPERAATLRIAFDDDKTPAEKRFDGYVRIHVSRPSPQMVEVPIHYVKP